MFAAQATSDPRLERIAPPAPTPSNPNPAPVLRPPYSIDEGSFVDACNWLVSIQDAAKQCGRNDNENRPRGGRDRRDGKSGGGGGSDSDDKAVLKDLLLRSLTCLASFRCRRVGRNKLSGCPSVDRAKENGF